MYPFYIVFEDLIKVMFSHCCGECAEMQNSNMFNDMSQVNATSINTSDLVFPILGRSCVNQLYGFWFISLHDVPSAYYVTKSQHLPLKEMLKQFYQFWQLLCICLLLAVLAGFIAWVLETPGNKDEFPRPFFIGLFEGFWWSFISMTTVGYGDKAPKSRTARVFSVVWILIGITVCSIFTASLTNIVTLAQEKQSSDMSGKKIGALKYRIYDAVVIAKHGWLIYAIDYDNVSSGITELFDILLSPSNIIDRFIVDRHTFYFYHFKTGNSDREKLRKTVFAEKLITTEKQSYGMLVKNTVDYYYFQKYIADNMLTFDTCYNDLINGLIENIESSRRGFLFATENGFFYPILISIGVTFGVILCFGSIYEVRRMKHASRLVEPNTYDISSS